MKIGITCYPTYGGSGIVATELGLELAHRGHEIHFITYANPIRLDPETPRVHYHEVEVSEYPLFHFPPYSLALASRMAEVAECYELDLLHVHYAIPHSISALLAQQMIAPRRRLPFVTTLHGTDITLVGMDRSYFPITKFSIEKIERGHDDQPLHGAANEGSVRRRESDRGDPQLRQCGDLPAIAGAEPFRESAAAYFKFPAGEARTRLHPDPGRGSEAHGRASADGRGWAGSRSGGTAGARPGRTR